MRVIEELGEDVSDFRNELSSNPRKSFFKLDLEKFTIDFLPVVPGFSRFSTAFTNRESIIIEGVELSFISLDDLVKSKVALSREKDIIDVKELRKRNERER